MSDGKLSHLVSCSQFRSASQLSGLFRLADQFRGHARPSRRNRYTPLQSARGRILATLFYEPSTRTRLSFESAQIRLGGEVLSTEAAGAFSSHAKGESLEDTIRVVSSYADAIVLRHPTPGAAARAAAVSSVPVINGGDGDNEHPTQALLDVYTIRCEVGIAEGLTVALVGDLKHSRTIHSLIGLLLLYPGVRLVLVSPDGLRLPEQCSRAISAAGAEVWCEDSLTGAVARRPDVVYMTRLQRERHEHGATTLEAWPDFCLNASHMKSLRDDAIVLHPLPRLAEVPAELDSDPRCAYFHQSAYGVAVRMAVLSSLYFGEPGADLGL